MRINGQKFHTIWVDNNKTETVMVIDQNKLPFEFSIKKLEVFNDAFEAIKTMVVRGAPLIGVTAAYGIYLALVTKKSDDSLGTYIEEKCALMKTARPTAVNLSFTVDIMMNALSGVQSVEIARTIAFEKALELKQAEIDYCDKIGEHGLVLIEAIADKKNNDCVNILTHCNAGWLACIDWGTATAPIYKAHKKGINVHVWVDETRPRNQGSRLTSFELLQEGVSHTVIADNTGGHLMQHGMVDLVIVGSDRTTCNGDVCNKIGTYLKALAAYDNRVPFYVALPSSSIDFNISNGLLEIPIEERHADEMRYIEGKGGKVQILPDGSMVANYGFDITPARLISGLITERGICAANKKSIRNLFPYRK